MSTLWSLECIKQWHDGLPWLVGCNFYPSSAINPIEMWAAESYDEETIARELAWAASLGFNLVRVYLHDIPWRIDEVGFFQRIDRVLSLADEQGVRCLPVIFDDCWFEPTEGRQPAPRPGIHNSGWVRSPGKERLMDGLSWSDLESYVKALGVRFGADERIPAWDVYNEVGNYYLPVAALSGDEQAQAFQLVEQERPAQKAQSLKLLERSFGWLREVGVSQPLTAPIWLDEEDVNQALVALSDFISFHHYGPVDELEAMILNLSQHQRPLWCSEYLSRPEHSRFETHLPVFREHKIAAINWGLVDGKSQTKYAWSDQGGGPEPEVWFHDVLRADGTPYDESEARFVRECLKPNQ